MAPPGEDKAETFDRAIERLNRLSVEAFNRGDVAACAALYAEDATMFLADRPAVQGRTAIEDCPGSLSAAGLELMPVDPVRTVSTGDIGYCAGTYLFRAPSEGGGAVTRSGKFVTVLRRQPDGGWKPVIDSFFEDTANEGRRPICRAGGGISGASAMTEDETRMRAEVRDVYQRGARFYDLAVWLYYAAGMRVGHWRRMAIEALALRAGDTVVEIGCGTGLNFALIEKAIGPEGRIIGVDLSEAMLARAKRRIRNAGWRNIELVCSGAAGYRFPSAVGGVIATGVLNYEPDYDEVIRRGAVALAPGRRWVILDYKMPTNWLRVLSPVFLFLGSAFGVSRKRMERRPWLSVQRYLRHTRMRELYGGFVYIVSGEGT